MIWLVKCNENNCSYSEKFADRYNASEYAKYHSRRSGHKNIDMEALTDE